MGCLFFENAYSAKVYKKKVIKTFKDTKKAKIFYNVQVQRVTL